MHTLCPPHTQFPTMNWKYCFSNRSLLNRERETRGYKGPTVYLLKKLHVWVDSCSSNPFCSGSTIPWGSSLNSDSESVITHFLIGFFIVSVLPTVFLKRLIFSLCQALQKLAARLIVTQEGLYPQLSVTFLETAHCSQQPLVLPCYSQLCLSEEGGFPSGPLQGRVTSSSSRSRSKCLIRALSLVFTSSTV